MASIDYGFISQLEGGQRLDAYVPAAVESKSGVTVATGFDLGARDRGDLERLCLPSSLIAKLQPYLGQQGLSAAEFLAGSPLSIAGSEADTIDRQVKAEHLDRLSARFEKASQREFGELSPEAQTVIASVSFQYGSLPRRTPNFWRQVTTGAWREALANLRDFGDRYRTRRNREADLLESASELN